MSEGDVSLIRDEDLLRRMWQQTEDFSRKKEIRAHMYRLREERLRDLYSPEPTRDGKGNTTSSSLLTGHRTECIRKYTFIVKDQKLAQMCPNSTGSEFSAAQGHVKSFADQSFQSMKSKEVRDAGSPPKEFTYRGQDLKALSNAGWNVESENKTTDDGHTHVKSVHANIEGRYDVDGGKGQFAAVDHHKEAVTEYHDDHSSLKRNQTSSNTAAREYVVRNTDDGTQISSTTSSSTSSSKFQQMSSTRHDTVPYLTNDDYDLRSYDTNRNEDASSMTRRQIIKTNEYDQSTENDYEQNLRKNEYQQHVSRNDYEQNITKNNYDSVKKNNYEQNVSRNDYETGELVSRKIDYPDDNTRVIVETRCLPDGTRVTSTKREFRAPVQSTRSEQSYQIRENKSYSTQQRSDVKESSKTTRHVTDNRVTDIVDSQRNVDDNDFKRQIADYTKDNKDYSDVKLYETKINKRVVDHSNADDNYSKTSRHVTKVTKEVTDNDDYVQRQQRTDQTHHRQYVAVDQRETTTRDTKTDTLTPRSDRPDNLTKQKERPESLTPRCDHPETMKPSDNNQENIEPNDNRPRQQRDSIHQETISTEEKTHVIKRENKAEESVERKTSTDRYQTTYQTDFPQKKISNDWSPSHQAWASTLRADTPTTTRPSTRASSPGSRTFRSSTSSLRSSVSPDKITRKPSSRGESPNKIDRSSPTRKVVDKHSVTHSTHSVTEVKTHKNTTLDDKRPPTGRSPTRPGYSPERKPHDHRQRPSVSPEKRPQDLAFRPSVSPDRKPIYRSSPTDNYPRTSSPSRPLDRGESPTRPRASPERDSPHKTTPTDKNPRTKSPSRPLDRNESPMRPRTSPERNSSNKETDTDNYPRTYSPTRPLDHSLSPTPDNVTKDTLIKAGQTSERKQPYNSQPDWTSELPRHTSPSRPHPTESKVRPGKSPDRKPQSSVPATDDTSPKRGSVSPDRKPGYTKPTSASRPSENLKGRTSPSKQIPSQSPERKPQNNSKTTIKVKDDHYKFIDEETKMYSRIEETEINNLKPSPTDFIRTIPKETITKSSPTKDTPDFRDATPSRRRSPSPKQHVTLTNQSKRVDTTQLTTDKEINTKYSIPKDKSNSSDKTTPREPSPSKYGTYDKKKPYEGDDTEAVRNTVVMTEDNKFGSQTHRAKSPKKTPSQPSSPTKKSPRDSVSPIKSPTKDSKFKHTTDFMSTEQKNEEVNKTVTKEHPRRLITPSSSPTRKPKPTDTEPSTGQSSPTTSVSGFVYFSSPRNEKTVVTDLDEQETYSETNVVDKTTTIYKRPESLSVNRPQSPTKIPCRSPSPEKRISPPKDSLPRKSSLKKPSNEITQASPIEKPPSSFSVSPTEDSKEFPNHKIVKKDHPKTPDTEAPTGKQKPPLERRETYEDRCRKILGMMDDTTTTTVTTKKTSHLREPEENLSSPNFSPCRSPATKETPFEYPSIKKTTKTKADVTDFIIHEQQNVIQKTTTHIDKLHDENTKSPRGTSPTKLQNISINTEKDVLGAKKVPFPRQSPERQSIFDEDSVLHKSTKTNLSPDKKPQNEQTIKKPEDKHPTDLISETKDFIGNTSIVSTKDEISTQEKISRSSESPTRKPGQQPDKITERKPSDHKNIPTKTNLDYEEFIKEKSPSLPNYNKTTTTTSMVVEYDSTSTIEDVEESVPAGSDRSEQNIQPSDVPTRQKPKAVNDTPTKHSFSSDKSPDRKASFDKPSTRASPEKKPKESSPSRTSHGTTVTSVTDYEITSAEDIQEHSTLNRVKSRRSPRVSESPTRKSPKSADDTPLHSTYTNNRSPDRKMDNREKTSSVRSSPEKTCTDRYKKDESPTKHDNVPGYMKTTKSATSKSEIISRDVEEATSFITTEKQVSLRSSESPTRKASETKDYPRTSSPPRSTELSDRSQQNKLKNETPQKRTSPEKQDLHKKEPSPTRVKPISEQTPGYMKAISSHVHRHNLSQNHTIESIERMHDHPRPLSPSKQPRENNSHREHVSPDRKQERPESADKEPRETSSSKSSPDTPNYMKKTSASIRKLSNDHVETSTKTIDSSPKTPHKQSSPDGILKHGSFSPRESPERHTQETIPKETSPIRKPSSITLVDTKESNYVESTTTSKDIKTTTTTNVTEKDHSILQRSSTSPPRSASKHVESSKPTAELPINRHSDISIKPSKTSSINTTEVIQQISHRSSSSPDRKPSYKKSPDLKTTSTDDIITVDVAEKHSLVRTSESPSRHTPHQPSKFQPDLLQQPEEPRQLRTPSPSKKTTKVTEISSDFISSEKEQEILDKVHKSVRKMSPERKEHSPSREKSPGKTTTSLQDIDITKHTETGDEFISQDFIEITEKCTVTKKHTSYPEKAEDEKPKDQKVPHKQTSRTVSPTKKPSGIATPTKVDKSPDSPTKRSVSPKKPISSTERPQSPQISKPSGIKPKEQIPSHLTRKPTPATLNITKVDKTATDIKKSTNVNSVTKQNSFTRTTNASKTTTKSIPSPTGRQNEPETKRAPTPKGIRDSIIPKKDNDTKVMRTSSDLTIKKKVSPQRMKSKPEIQVSDMSTKSTVKTTKSSVKEPHSKLPSKPKSATTLNTSIDDDDIIVDVEQSKSSRENSPDRICPTPVNFGEDIGTPRYPDEVSEPDDEFRRRTHHTIHEAESIVDDIVEICEDDELFVRKTDVDVVTDEDESLLSVTDKVSRFSKGVDTVHKSKDTTTIFKETEKRVHSDFIDDKLKSDECLLSVSEKVNKFAKGPKDTRESRSPSRRVTDEYDRNTVYQDDYTKLSVHDKAHLFVETAENVKMPKLKPTPQRVERPDLSNVDDSLKSDDCLLSVSDKVHKFVKTAEQFLSESHEGEENEKKIKEQHEKIMRKIVTDVDEDEQDIERTTFTENTDVANKSSPNQRDEKTKPKESSSLPKIKDSSKPNMKPNERTPTVKITTLRSSEAVKKAKALFENIATTTTQKTKETAHVKPSSSTKLTDIGVIKKPSKTDYSTVLHPPAEDESPHVTDVDSQIAQPQKDRPTSGITTRPRVPQSDDGKPRSSPSRLNIQPADVPRSKSPMRQTIETTTTTKTIVSRYPVSQRAESPRQRPEAEKPEKVPGYLRPTKTSQIKEETKVIEDTEVSSRRGSGKFGVELRRTSVERSTVSSERRRSVEHPCIEDIFDLDLLEQMLEKVVGYEQRRRIRSQIRIAKKRLENEHTDTKTYTKTARQTVTTQKLRSPERQYTRSPERNASKATPHKESSPDRHTKAQQRTIPERTQPKEPVQPVHNGYSKESNKTLSDRYHRPQSPDKPTTKSVPNSKSPVRQPSPDKKTRTHSPSKTAAPKPKSNRFNEYASAYMKKVGLSEADKIKFAEAKSKKTAEENQRTIKHTEHKIVEEYSTAKSFTDEIISRDVIEVVQQNGTNKRSPSPEKPQSPGRKAHSPERIHERTPSPTQKQKRTEPAKKETIIKTVYEIEKKIPQKQVQEEKPSWVTNRNLKKISSETRTFSSKKIEEKPKYRAPSPSKAITKPIDVITSSYGPGPLDADGKPLFGIRALRNGASNYQVKGTVIRQEYHSRNGGEPEGTVSVTAYSTEPEDLERLLQGQGEPPSRIHGLAAITTTKKFGGDTGTTLKEAHGREDRAAIDQFTHSDRRVSDTGIEDITERISNRREEIVGETRRIESRREEIIGDRSRQAREEIIDSSKDRREDKSERMQRRVDKVEKKGDRPQERRERIERTDDKKTVRQSSVKSLTEKYIKSANESSKAERVTYPKAGLILRTSTMKDSVSSDSSAHAGQYTTYLPVFLLRRECRHTLSNPHRQRAQPGLGGGHDGDDVGAGGWRSEVGHHHHPHPRLHHAPLPAREVLPRQQHQGHRRAGHSHQDEEC
ncbi:hypothetical protein HF086_014997 [Spodoptera exigua]|uniref:Smoothelin domain-containing protein n=1 Tax=Spodoptera exigua TaxID=7107 RepID=A0A922MF60_SPOEX|nr:hypothetical protein HF086_014997 [Spodoptera exigua]